MVLQDFFLPKTSASSRKARRGLSWSSSSLTRSFPARAPAQDARYIWDEAMLEEEKSPEEADLKTLNGSLALLASIFPDVQPEVFREMLSSYGEESRLHVVTEALLKHKAKWVRGQWRVPGKDGPAGPTRSAAASANAGGAMSLAVEERFRSEPYKRAVRGALYQEFRDLSHSAINAVLAEHNYSYTLSRPTLVALSSKSWRSSLSSFFTRRKPSVSMSTAVNPLLVWRLVEGGTDESIPMLRSTGSAELDRELFESLIRPLQQTTKEAKEDRDHEMALQANEAEAEAVNAMYECGCCFSSTTFEQMVACDRGGHCVCFSCVRHVVQEALFGQGWAKNVDGGGKLRCITPMPDDRLDCEGRIPSDLLHRALVEERGGEEVWQKLEERVASDALQKSQVPLVRCPFCPYAEVDDVQIHASSDTWRIKRAGMCSLTTILLVMVSGAFSFFLSFFLLITILTLLHPSTPSLPAQLSTQLSASLTRLARRRRGLKFTCQSPMCARSSCMSCEKEWRDIHICYESERLALRAHVERAMSSAVKRTCPRCNLSFVKASGCNKLTCVCGYHMCYVCRKEIGNEGYRHFCEHFRPKGAGACEVCDKCDLYRAEDEARAVRQAAEDAEREWRSNETGAGGRALEDWRWERRDDFAGTSGGLSGIGSGSGGGAGATWLRPSTWQGWTHLQKKSAAQDAFDWLVENLVELP
ncbi:MAG: hypothetical protein M1838_004524 [Thelocarpon superellum]|nr:MAG: hypothetical protein M1838_004524 [Thelocarpon superellum]